MVREGAIPIRQGETAKPEQRRVSAAHTFDPEGQYSVHIWGEWHGHRQWPAPDTHGGQRELQL